MDGLAEDYVEHDRVFPGATTSLEEAKAKRDPLADALSGLTITIEDTVAEGARVAVSAAATATHTGEFYGVHPTGERIEWALMVFADVEDGQVVETGILRDVFGTMTQLDLTP